MKRNHVSARGERSIGQMQEMKMDPFYNRPVTCEKCGSSDMIFRGVGEFRCEKCGHLAYDDYGKVRIYIETHPGATASEIENTIGVKQKVIRQLLKEERIEIAPESKAFLKCEICGIDIRSGRLCPACAAKRQEMISVEEAKKQTKKKGQGYGQQKGEEGSKRFTRK